MAAEDNWYPICKHGTMVRTTIFSTSTSTRFSTIFSTTTLPRAVAVFVSASSRAGAFNAFT
eukprot:145346-Pyramimonas_sp.AAC.2